MNYFEVVKRENIEKVDWSKVPVDTKVLVSKDNEIWHRRYFAKYEDGVVYCFTYGVSSFSTDDISDVVAWEYAKLYQE